MKRIRERRGMLALIARELGLSHQSVVQWKQVPLQYVFQVGSIAKIKPELLRPDFFANDPLRQAIQ